MNPVFWKLDKEYLLVPIVLLVDLNLPYSLPEG